MVKTLIGPAAHAVGALLLGTAMLLGGCASQPSAPKEITLAGVVVDGQRLADRDETGHVQVGRNGAWMAAGTGTVLQDGDWISTGARGYALVRYPSGSELYLRPNTRGRIGSFSELVGEVFAKIRGAFSVQTTFVKAGAEGTAYSVRANAAGEYVVAVYEGKVQLSSLSNAWTPLLLDTGYMSAGRPQVPPRPVATPPEEAARTRAWVERVERLTPAPPKSSGIGPVLAILGAAAVIAAASSSDSDDLAAPTGLTPGSPASRDPAIVTGCRSLTLSWRPVNGARDYIVTIEGGGSTRLSSSGPASASRTTSSNSLSLGSVGTGAYRWHVQARDARGRTSPNSETVYFHCRAG